MTLGPLDVVALVVLLGVLPLLSLAQGRMLTDEMVESIEREPVYLGSAGMLVVLGAFAAWVGGRHGGLATLGLGPLAVGPLLGWTLALTAAALTAVMLFRGVGKAVGAREHPALRAILPRTRRERRIFLVVSGAAGVCEEVAYRGYPLAVLVPLMGGGGALLLTSGVFGLLHAYQGSLGMARTASVGALLGMGLLASGSLWPSILAHTLVNIVAAGPLGEHLMVPEPDSRV